MEHFDIERHATDTVLAALRILRLRDCMVMPVRVRQDLDGRVWIADIHIVGLHVGIAQMVGCEVREAETGWAAKCFIEHDGRMRGFGAEFKDGALSVEDLEVLRRRTLLRRTIRRFLENLGRDGYTVKERLREYGDGTPAAFIDLLNLMFGPGFRFHREPDTTRWLLLRDGNRYENPIEVRIENLPPGVQDFLMRYAFHANSQSRW